MKIIIPILQKIQNSSFNSIVMNFIWYFQIPLIKKIFETEGALIVHPRGSLVTRTNFNFLYSDLDFSIVAPSSRHSAILRRADKLKKIFLNLGELEIYTYPEWEILTDLMNGPYNHLWNKLQLIRKSKWQRLKMSEATNAYDQEKHARGLGITLDRLGSKEYVLDGTKIFSLGSFDERALVSIPSYSPYLEREIALDTSNQESILFRTKDEATAFLSILPDSDLLPESLTLKSMKLSVIQRERLQTLTSLRLKKFQDSEFNDQDYQQWLRDLERRSKEL